ncbi:MAG: hypothetical protein MKZ96_01240 [Candidatus Atelocyanobacterium sp. ALOHA_A2.5_9]|nr:hypothetical protein [Candidatus Atelocyanobacterium sp. ALOHA_A2.5_9]
MRIHTYRTWWYQSRNDDYLLLIVRRIGLYYRYSLRLKVLCLQYLKAVL